MCGCLVPEEFLLYARQLSDKISIVTHSEIRMIPLERSDESDFVDVLLPFDIRKSTVHVAYDILFHKVRTCIRTHLSDISAVKYWKVIIELCTPSP